MDTLAAKDPEMKKWVVELTSNFDDFPDEPMPGSSSSDASPSFNSGHSRHVIFTTSFSPRRFFFFHPSFSAFL
jgi:hypothetical protein